MPAAPPPSEPPLLLYPLRLHPRVLVGYGSLLGAVMVAMGVGWALIAGQDGPGAWFPRERWLAELLLGALLGCAFAALAWALFGRISALQRIERRLVAVLDMAALRLHHALIFGLLAGVPEEILFRGALQPALGLLATSLLFGALHAVTFAYFVYAAVAGALLGALALWRGALWAPIAAHTLVDVIMLALLIRRWRAGTRAVSSSPQTKAQPAARGNRRETPIPSPPDVCKTCQAVCRALTCLTLRSAPWCRPRCPLSNVAMHYPLCIRRPFALRSWGISRTQPIMNSPAR